MGAVIPALAMKAVMVTVDMMAATNVMAVMVAKAVLLG